MVASAIRAATQAELAQLRELTRSRSKRRASGLYVLEGRRSVDQALALGEELALVFASPDQVDRYQAVGDRLRVVPKRRLEQISSLDTSDGVIGVKAIVTEPLASVAERDCILVPIGLQDPGNLGTLLRSALAFFERVGLVVGPDTVDPFSPKVVRATTGLLGLVAIHETDDYGDCLVELGERGVTGVALVPHAGVSLTDVAPAAPIALLIGSEAHGIPDELCSRCAWSVSIAQRSQVESLNAGVAGSIALFHLAALGG